MDSILTTLYFVCHSLDSTNADLNGHDLYILFSFFITAVSIVVLTVLCSNAHLQHYCAFQSNAVHLYFIQQTGISSEEKKSVISKRVSL
jgi:hypothetical protein